MKSLSRALIRYILVMAAILFLAGCEDDDDDSDQDADTTVEAEGETAETHPNFPDGLHPDSTGDSIIAQTFAASIDPSVGGTVLCIGDSITAGGYPGPLAGITGMNVVDSGSGGEKSGVGASRIAGEIAAYTPTYVCILYGANDVLGGVDPATIAANIATMIQAAHDGGAAAIVGTLTPLSGEFAEFNDDARAASSAIRSTASSYGASVADLENQF